MKKLHSAKERDWATSDLGDEPVVPRGVELHPVNARHQVDSTRRDADLYNIPLRGKVIWRDIERVQRRSKRPKRMPDRFRVAFIWFYPNIHIPRGPGHTMGGHRLGAHDKKTRAGFVKRPQ